MNTDGKAVRITSEGRVTIPKEVRETLDIDTPGRIRFDKNERGEVVVNPVPRPSDVQGMLREERTEAPTAILRRDRERDRIR
ncbi:AbrB/MazE/SpoVT family DNA-binding domain-containing protein [Natronomonas sp. EA1]|uniref:AbrB/MazE/SpoVT family DNA-binding domain-containing protein n=1 Tax=Natronomonas sp. EA1 TaxID=3421655 RepID=UPI003EBA0239